MSRQSEKIRRQLSAYLDGELPEAQAGEVAEAVRRDAELAAELSRLRAVKGLIAGLPRASAPADLAQRVLARAAARGEPPRVIHAGAWFRRLSAAAVVLLAVGVGAIVFVQVRAARKAAPAVAMLNHRGAAAVAAKDAQPYAESSEPPPAKPAGPDSLALAMKKEGLAKGLGDTLPPGGGREAKLGDVLAEGGGEKALAERRERRDSPAAPVLGLVINVADVPKAQAAVERVFVSNGLVAVEQTPSGVVQAKQQAPARGQFYNQVQVTPRQVRYELAIDEGQWQRIVAELNEVRARQNVPQVPSHLADEYVQQTQSPDLDANKLYADASKQAQDKAKENGRTSRAAGELEKDRSRLGKGPASGPSLEERSRVQAEPAPEVALKPSAGPAARGEQTAPRQPATPPPAPPVGGSGGGGPGQRRPLTVTAPAGEESAWDQRDNKRAVTELGMGKALPRAAGSAASAPAARLRVANGGVAAAKETELLGGQDLAGAWTFKAEQSGGRVSEARPPRAAPAPAATQPASSLLLERPGQTRTASRAADGQDVRNEVLAATQAAQVQGRFTAEVESRVKAPSSRGAAPSSQGVARPAGQGQPSPEQQQVGELAGANLRQFVVILNAVEVREGKAATTGQ